ncbi:single-stranded-DNA-specific exonuclease RecJ [bacterium]|jgi:single-stranded-DNA-specific exonuclease|nr:single-stranded-DNA-specific exonuclease RecJ [Rubripirellula sp.]MDA7936746.1 single-stranded-DNA-specific exonuclease RecJ [bacterium]MDB4533140.1 single-stranded-DNA-specific exonuclease RecJ [bacterium]MDB4644523.1 single-stranded-DNA-specific exonuclease RecJ [Rubripirellula sp.]
MKRQWRIIPHDADRVESLIQSTRLPAVVAQLLVSRGIYTSEDASRFLDTKLMGLRDPQELPGIPEATSILIEAIENKTPIVIYGDYDCDGMTGTAILVNGLRLFNADVSYHVPNRLEDGYGLNDEAIRKLADRGKKLIVSVDCGITSVSHAELCKELGVKLVITDHHTIGEQLPDADAIVHPRLPGTTYPFGELCGAGVAFKLAWSLCQSICGAKKVTERMRRYLMQSLSLTAIGTVADVVPLLDENRILVEHGIRMLRAEPLPGLTELMKVTKLDQVESLNTESIGFTIAPRLNAAGRLGQAQLAVELMTISPGERATQLAEYIHQLNTTRDSLQRSVYLAADKQAKSDFEPESDPALVLAGVGWHQGVIGVVAGRLADKYAKPVFVISQDAAGKSEAVGSGRVGGTNINLYDALCECDHRLVRFGGHKAAAGLTISEREIDSFRGDFNEAVAKQWHDKEIVPEIVIDAEATLGQLNLEVLKQMDMLAPFGAANPRPVLFCRNVELDEPARKMGGGDRHLTVNLRQGKKVIRGVAFGAGDWCDELNATEGPIEIAYRPVVNDFRGFRKVEIHLVDWRPATTLAAV